MGKFEPRCSYKIVLIKKSVYVVTSMKLTHDTIAMANCMAAAQKSIELRFFVLFSFNRAKNCFEKFDFKEQDQDVNLVSVNSFTVSISNAIWHFE